MNYLFWISAVCVSVVYLYHVSMNPFVLVLIGAFGLWQASDKVVELAKKVAESLRLSHVLIGLTIISIGTSFPEILTSIFSGVEVLKGNPNASGIAVGTTIGSCLTQITLILGITGLVRNVHTNKKVLFRDGSMVLFAIIALFLLGVDGSISAVDGLLMMLGYFVYIIYISRDEKDVVKFSDEHELDKKGLVLDIFLICIGLAVLLGSASLVVKSATRLAENWGIATSFIGVMFIGVSTALPELSTAITGVLKDAHGISVGTLIGSNITDPMFSLAIGSIIAGGAGGFLVDHISMSFYIPFWFFATGLALYLVHRRELTLDRYESTVLIACYIFFAFISWKIGFFGI